MSEKGNAKRLFAGSLAGLNFGDFYEFPCNPRKEIPEKSIAPRKFPPEKNLLSDKNYHHGMNIMLLILHFAFAKRKP